MNATFKHRLLGTSILLMLAIIFLPDLLDGEKQVVKDDFKVIPDRPEFQGVASVPAFADEAVAALLAETNVDNEGSSEVGTGSELPSQQFASVTVNQSGQATVTEPTRNSTTVQTASTANTNSAPARDVTAPSAASQPQINTAAANSTQPSAASPASNQPSLNQAAWVVRVGSFSNQQNANALMARLRQEGFTSFSRQIVNANGQQLTSVFVGPEIRRDRLEQRLAKLQQITGIERLVISNYQPTENN